MEECQGPSNLNEVGLVEFAGRYLSFEVVETLPPVRPKIHVYVRAASPANGGLGCHQVGIKEANVSGVALLSQSIWPVEPAEDL
jgi:hypothetical protein